MLAHRRDRRVRSCARVAALAAWLLTWHLTDLAGAQPPAEPELPTLPETTVVGQAPREPASNFPSEPLDAGTVVSPSRTATSRREVGSSVTVISRDELVQSGQSNVAEVLRGRLGVDVVRSGGPGGVTSVFLRGGNSEHTKVLLDGIPLNDPSHPTRAFDFSTLDLANVERIEVLQGPQSLFYGSDAIGGVINIVTRRGSGPPTVAASTMGGSFGTVQQTLNVAGGNPAVYYSLSGSYLHTDGISQAARRLGNTEKDRYRLGSLSGRVGWNAGEQWNIDYVFRYVDAENEIDSFQFPAGFTDDLLRYNTVDSFYNRVQLQSLAMDGLIENRVGFSFTDYERGDSMPDFGPAAFHGVSRQVDWRSNLQVAERNVLSAGIDYLQEEASTSLVTQRQQRNAGVYLEDRWNLSEVWYATAGARWDDHSAAGTANTYRMTSVLHADPLGLALHGSLGTGFRAPALAQNFFNGGNPDLRPERSKGWDLGVQQTLADGWLSWDVTYFRNDFRDLIIFDFATFLSQNIGRARASGVEATSTVVVTEKTTATVRYTLNDTIDLEFGGKLPRRPQQKASFVLTRQLSDRGQLNAYLYYVGDRLDFAERFGGELLQSYVLLNVSGRWRVNDSCELFGRIDNLLDEDYEEAADFGVPGVSFYAGLNVVR